MKMEVFLFSYGLRLLCFTPLSAILPGADPGFQVREGGALKKIIFFPILGGTRRVRPPPGSASDYSVIPWRSVLLAEETGENHKTVASHRKTFIT